MWWFRADGRKMTSRDWEHGEAVLGMFLNGHAILTPGPRGEEVEDDSFVLLFNAHDEDRSSSCRAGGWGRAGSWSCARPIPTAQAGQRRLRRRRSRST